MSKQRAQARAERERAAAERAARQAETDASAARTRERRARRTLTWRRMRLWQHGPAFRRQREAWGLFVTMLALCLFAAYLLTRSVADVIGTALILLIVGPVLWMVLRSRR